jgi:enoyl-CoA hydratase/carnithine racemase
VDVVGPGRVKDLLFTGRLVGAEEAHAIGLVNRVVPGDELERAVRDLAHAIASNAPLTLRATKEMIRRLLVQRRLPAGADHDLVEMCYSSADFREGVAAFLAKRPPQWTGR